MNTMQKGKKLQRNTRYMMEIRMNKLLNVVLVIVPFMVGWFAFYRSRVCGNPTILRSMGMMTMYMMLYCIFGQIYDAFLVSHKRISEVISSQILAVLMADAFISDTFSWKYPGFSS